MPPGGTYITVPLGKMGGTIYCTHVLLLLGLDQGGGGGCESTVCALCQRCC